MPLKQYIKGNSIALNMYINKEESSHDNDLSFPLRNIKKKNEWTQSKQKRNNKNQNGKQWREQR